jgi:hypothetical protein
MDHFAKNLLVILLTNHPYYDNTNNMSVHKNDIKRASLYMPRAIAAKVQEYAKRHRRSFNQEIIWLVEQSLTIDKDISVNGNEKTGEVAAF